MLPTASSLRCPSCGAPSNAGSSRCEYCRTALATISCPTCFKLLYEGSSFCPHCGSPRSRADAAQAASLKCPACRGAMRWVTVGAVDLLECVACDGTWVEAETFARLCADRDAQAAVVSRRPIDRAPMQQPVRYRPCPRCGKLMNRINFARLSGTIVDVCRSHGTFLDRGELHALVEFIRNGGLDRARQLEREALVEEQRRLRALEQGAGHVPAERTGWTEHGLLEFLETLSRRHDG